MLKTESSIVQVTNLQQLEETLFELEKELSTPISQSKGIQFNGEAWLGVWQAEHSDIGNLTTYFEGSIILKISNYGYHIGETPCAYDYNISLLNNEYPKARFRYYLQSGEKQPPWQTDKTHSNALTLRQRIKKDIFPEVKGVLLWVN